MAICDLCNREMVKATTCHDVPVIIGAQYFHPIRYGDGHENEHITSETHPRCHDCGVRWGGYHHPGCDMEQCPKCGDQLIACGCLIDC